MAKQCSCNKTGLDKFDEHGNSYLQILIMQTDTTKQTIQHVITVHHFSLTYKNHYKQDALLVACKYGKSNIVKYLAKKQMNLCTDTTLRNGMDYACERQTLELILCLVSFFELPCQSANIEYLAQEYLQHELGTEYWNKCIEKVEKISVEQLQAIAKVLKVFSLFIE